MIGPRLLPAHFEAWNHRWGAPNGRFVTQRRLLPTTKAFRARRRLALLARAALPPLVGPFGFQPNNDTRFFEYPWAFYATPLDRGMTAVELGGSLGGFQFVLSRVGLKVTNIDPGEGATIGWPVSHRAIKHLNRWFRTDVELVSNYLEYAHLEDRSIDRVFSISTLEHIPQAELPALFSEVARILKPGGHVVLTVDLFLDLAPFSEALSNSYGTNVSVADIVKWSGLELVQGFREELYGFDEFDARRILSKLPEYLYGGGYPVLAQALVLQKQA